MHSDFLRGDFEELLEPSTAWRAAGNSKTVSEDVGNGRRHSNDQAGPSGIRLQASKAATMPMSASLAIPSSRAYQPSAHDNPFVSPSMLPHHTDPPEPPSRPTPIQPKRWQALRGKATSSDGGVITRVSPEEPGSVCTAPESYLGNESPAEQSSLAPLRLAGMSRLVRGRKLGKRRRRALSRSQDDLDYESAFTRCAGTILPCSGCRIDKVSWDKFFLLNQSAAPSDAWAYQTAVANMPASLTRATATESVACTSPSVSVTFYLHK